MIILLNILLALFLLATWPILLVWALIGRHRLGDRLGFVQRCSPGAIWIHAASVGESGVAVSLEKIVERIAPERDILLSATTRTGLRRLLKMQGPNCSVCALPADFPLFVSIAMSRVKPSAIIIVETELWPNLLLAAKRRAIPVILVNGRISETTLTWARRFPKSFKKVASCVEYFLMKSENDAGNLEETGVSRDSIEVFGNLKSAGIPKEVILAKVERKPMIVAGSIRPKEFGELLAAFDVVKGKYPGALFVAAPRHLNVVAKLTNALEEHELDFVLRSSGEPPGEADVYILNTMGELLSFYAACDVAFVGGTLADYGGHNPLEPAYFGKPVLFGPYQSANSEAFDALISASGGRTVNNAEELANVIIQLLDDENKRNKMGSAAREVVEKMRRVFDKYEMALQEIIGSL